MKKVDSLDLIINCDTGIDDAVALLLAVKSKKINIKLIVTDLGNVDPKQAAINTNNILEAFNAPSIKVVAGEGKCLKRERPRVAVHGNGGLGEYVFEKNNREVSKEDAIEAMYNTIVNAEKPITIVSLSPVTNIAKLIIKHPDCTKNIERLVFMAGSVEDLKPGDLPYPEFNVATDPEAAVKVFESGIKIDIVPMEMGHTAYLDWQDVFNTKNLNFTGSMLEILYRSYKDRHVKNGIATHDGCAIAYLTNPEIFEVKQMYGSIKYFDSLDSGILVLNNTESPNVDVCTKIDIKKFKKLYFDALAKCN